MNCKTEYIDLERSTEGLSCVSQSFQTGASEHILLYRGFLTDLALMKDVLYDLLIQAVLSTRQLIWNWWNIQVRGGQVEQVITRDGLKGVYLTASQQRITRLQVYQSVIDDWIIESVAALKPFRKQEAASISSLHS